MMMIEPQFLEIRPVQGGGLSKYFKLRERAKVAFRQKRREESHCFANLKYEGKTQSQERSHICLPESSNIKGKHNA